MLFTLPFVSGQVVALCTYTRVLAYCNCLEYYRFLFNSISCQNLVLGHPSGPPPRYVLLLSFCLCLCLFFFFFFSARIKKYIFFLPPLSLPLPTQLNALVSLLLSKCSQFSLGFVCFHPYLFPSRILLASVCL